MRAPVDKPRLQAEVACINNGGMWASINDGGATCLRLEKQ